MLMTDDMQDDLRSLIRAVLDMPAGSVRPADQNQTTEGDRYAIVQVSEMNPMGWAGESVDAYQTGVADITIDFMGKDALSYANRLPIAMQSFFAVNLLLGLSMGYMGCSSARNLTKAELDRISRYRVVMQLSYSMSYQPPQVVTDGFIEMDNININLIGES